MTAFRAGRAPKTGGVETTKRSDVALETKSPTRDERRGPPPTLQKWTDGRVASSRRCERSSCMDKKLDSCFSSTSDRNHFERSDVRGVRKAIASRVYRCAAKRRVKNSIEINAATAEQVPEGSRTKSIRWACGDGQARRVNQRWERMLLKSWRPAIVPTNRATTRSEWVANLSDRRKPS